MPGFENRNLRHSKVENMNTHNVFSRKKNRETGVHLTPSCLSVSPLINVVWDTEWNIRDVT